MTIEPADRLLYLIGHDIPSYSVAALGVQPYINALIVLALVPLVSKTVRAMAQTGQGRRSLGRWLLALTALFALFQAYGYTLLLETASIASFDPLHRFALILTLAAGTLTLVFLAGAIDEHGLGFGYGIFVIYVLGFVAVEIGRLQSFAQYAVDLGPDAFRPLELWALAFAVMMAASVFMLRAHRALPLLSAKGAAGLVVVPVLTSGVLRPAAYAGVIMYAPVAVARYYAQISPQVPTWFEQHWTAFGTNPWTDAGYMLVHACVIVAMAFLSVASDFGGSTLANRLRHLRVEPAGVPEGPDLDVYLGRLAWRLTLIGGVFIAMMVAVVPRLASLLTQGPNGNRPSISGAEALLIPAVVLAIVSAAGSRRDQLILTPRMP